MSRRTSVLDLGSNSFHVLVADVHDEGWVDPVVRERQMLHLGRAVAEHDGVIPQDAADEAVASVEHLSELARRTGATEHLAVATSALREARNGREVIGRIASAAGVPVRVLPGTEEARLSYLGVRAALGVSPGGLAVLDLGGGSLELAIGTERTPDLVTSANLGVSRLSTLVADDPVTATDRSRIADAVERELDLAGGAFATTLPARVVAVGGTVRAMARVVAAVDHPWVPMTLNRLPLATERLAALCEQLCALDRDGRAALPGMKARRADHLHVAALVLTEVLRALRVPAIEVSDWGLREGVLLDAAGASAAATPAELQAREARRLHEAFTGDDPHNPHTAALAVQLFDATLPLHGLGDEDRALLHHAAMVHDVGEALALRRHHRHGAYIVEHAELRGFSPGEAAQLTTLVRFHNSRGIHDDYPPAQAMTAERRAATEVLLALLQAADGLDRTRDQAVTGLRVVSLDDDRLVLQLEGRGLGIAKAELRRKTAVFRRVLGRELEVRTPVVV